MILLHDLDFQLIDFFQRYPDLALLRQLIVLHLQPILYHSIKKVMPCQIKC